MNLFTASFILSFFPAATSVSAKESVLITIRSMLHESESAPITPSELKALNNTIAKIVPTLDKVVDRVCEKAGIPLPPDRNLRVSEERTLTCNPCGSFVAPWCFSSGAASSRCRRALIMHEAFTEDVVANLADDERRRHLQVASLCAEAIHDVTVAIDVPLPDGAKYTEQCFYEIISL
jgi:hypothetical protein